MNYLKSLCFFFVVWVGVGVFLTLSPVLAARVTGEDGVAPIKSPAAPLKAPVTAQRESAPEPDGSKPGVTIDFDQVDIPIFIKFISELTGKNFVIEKGVRGQGDHYFPQQDQRGCGLQGL